MTIKKFPIFMSMLLFFSILTVFPTYAETPVVSSGAAILMDADTGEILYEKNSTQRLYPASITKVMTALLALENGNLEDTMTLTYDAVFTIERGSSHIALDVDEEITLEQGLYALLMMSANDAANGIAEHIGGTTADFADLMTKRAKELGAKDTSFKNAHGLYNKDHYTTAYDMALIAKEALKFPKFLDIIGTTNYSIPPTNKQEETRYFYNQHKMLRPEYSFKGILGGKTGFTNESRHTLVTYVEQNGTTLVSVIMKADSQDMMYKDTLKLMDYGFNQMARYSFIKGNQVLSTIPIYNELDENNKGKNKLGYVDLVALDDFTFYGDATMEEKDITTVYSFKEPLTTPVYKDEVLGKAIYMYRGTELGSVNVAVGQTYEKIDTSLISTFKKTANIEKVSIFSDKLYYLALALLLLICVALVFTIIRRSKRRRF